MIFPGCCKSHNQDPPCTLNWGCIVPNSRYIGPKPYTLNVGTYADWGIHIKLGWFRVLGLEFRGFGVEDLGFKVINATFASQSLKVLCCLRAPSYQNNGNWVLYTLQLHSPVAYDLGKWVP